MNLRYQLFTHKHIPKGVSSKHHSGLNNQFLTLTHWFKKLSKLICFRVVFGGNFSGTCFIVKLAYISDGLRNWVFLHKWALG